MRTPLVAGNWKMNGSRAFCHDLIGELKGQIAGLGGIDVVMCPPYPFLGEVGALLADTSVELGAQNLALEVSGAYTGEVSGEMLRDYNCSFVIVGHSERRALYGELDAVVAAKFKVARQQGLRPIVCVGETLADREAGTTEAVVGQQLDAILSDNAIEELEHSVLAYEPVWAIGTGKTASPEQAQAVHEFIRAQVAARDVGIAERIRILYGGSVNAGNAATLLQQADIDGGLIGGASLKAADFAAICAAAATQT